MLQSSKFEIQILQPRQTWRVYESSRSKYTNSKGVGFHIVRTKYIVQTDSGWVMTASIVL